MLGHFQLLLTLVDCRCHRWLSFYQRFVALLGCSRGRFQLWLHRLLLCDCLVMLAELILGNFYRFGYLCCAEDVPLWLAVDYLWYSLSLDLLKLVKLQVHVHNWLLVSVIDWIKELVFWRGRGQSCLRRVEITPAIVRTQPALTAIEATQSWLLAREGRDANS